MVLDASYGKPPITLQVVTEMQWCISAAHHSHIITKKYPCVAETSTIQLLGLFCNLEIT